MVAKSSLYAITQCWIPESANIASPTTGTVHDRVTALSRAPTEPNINAVSRSPAGGQKRSVDT